MGIDARHYSADEILRDGGSIHVRAIRPDDKQRLRDTFRRLSAKSAYYRFLRSKTDLSERELAWFTELDFERHVGLVATLIEDGEERIIAVGRYIVLPTDESVRRAELAFAVADRHQGRGVGTVLLEHLAAIARAGGVTEFEADVLGENNRMLELFATSGFLVRRSLQDGVMHVSFPTEETELSRQAADQRELLAEARSVRNLLQPSSIAVVAESWRSGGAARRLLDGLERAGFTGRLYAVDPGAGARSSPLTYAGLASIGQAIDLALLVAPLRALEEQVGAAARARVRGAVVFAETAAAIGDGDPAGLVRIARASGMRLIGPTSLGVINTDPAVRLAAALAPREAPAGNVGVLSESGALGLAMLDHLAGMDLGISSLVAVGRRADISSNDVLAYWAEDPRTAVIALYLESFGNPHTFAPIVREVARRKPIVAVKSGGAVQPIAPQPGAALAAVEAGMDDLLEQLGVLRTETLGELFGAVALLSTQPPPRGPRVAVVTNARAPVALIADACLAHGLSIAAPGPETCQALHQRLPGAPAGNPIDLGPAPAPAAYARAVEALGADPNVDAVIAVCIPPLVPAPGEIADAIAAAADALPDRKPVLAVLLSASGEAAVRVRGPRASLPCYAFPEDAALALSASYRYRQWCTRPPPRPRPLHAFARSAVRAVLDRLLAQAGGPMPMPRGDLTAMLHAAGIRCATSEEAGPESAIEVAERLGYPLVVKAYAGSERGGRRVAVATGIDSPQALERALALLARRMPGGVPLRELVLQREVAGGRDAIAAVVTHPTFGRVVTCGLGGALGEILRDVSARLPPIGEAEAGEMVGRLRLAPLLDAYRGAPAADRAALVSILVRLSALLEAAPEIRELELEPIRLFDAGAGAVVLDARLVLAPPSPPA
jgi:acyl-CoA synthetase (NDP forming)/GNAT superfamily N-acetyltransferase